jgi:PAP2 superfamily
MIRRFLITLILFNLGLAHAEYTTQDFKEEITSPWSHHVNNVFWTGTALTLLAVAIKPASDPLEDDVSNNRPLGKWSKFGNITGLMYPNAIYALGQTVAGLSGNKHGHKRAIGMTKATLYSSGITLALKKIVREPRPNSTTERDSFPSAHSTHAFSFGGYVFAQHGWQWGVPALFISSFSAASRINDNRHRLHDVIAGATIGLSYGLGLGWLNRKHEEEEDSSASVFFAPLYDGDIKGVAVVGEF